MNVRVYRQLRHLLVDDGHVPGSPLDTNDLTERLRTTSEDLAGALARLTSEGFVVQPEGEGPRVRGFQPDDIHELIVVRTTTETAIARLVIERATDSDFRELSAMQRAVETLLAHGGEVPRDRNFHGTIARLAGDEALEHSLGLAYDQLRMARPATVRHAGNREAWREHGVILRALMTRDADATEQAVVAHLQSIERALLGSLD